MTDNQRRQRTASGRSSRDHAPGSTSPSRSSFNVDYFHVGAPPNAPAPISYRAWSPSSPTYWPSLKQTRIDFRELEYRDDVDSNLICLICHCPFDDPVRLACDHSFCSNCLETAFEYQRTDYSTCPTCRSHVDRSGKLEKLPRVVIRMLDELVAKCPNATLGCEWTDKRMDVQNHVDFHCGYSIANCPSADCQHTILRKDIEKGCLHYHVNCEECGESVIRGDLEHHQNDVCSKRLTPCSHCDLITVKGKLKAHLNEDCLESIIDCPGQSFGCQVSLKRREMRAHAQICPMAVMAPYLGEQRRRQEEQEAEIQRLQRRVEFLESGLSAINAALIDNPSPPSPDLSPLGTLSTNLPATAPLAAQVEASPPFDSSIHHVLSLYESLREDISRSREEVREEIARVETSLADLDARTTMRIVNGDLRAKDEMAHANAAINSMRMQLQWLMSARLQQAQARASTGAVGPSSASRAGSGASSGASGTASRSGLQPIRRLSDSNRQETKL